MIPLRPLCSSHQRRLADSNRCKIPLAEFASPTAPVEGEAAETADWQGVPA